MTGILIVVGLAQKAIINHGAKVSHKTIVKVAIVMLVVFGATVLLYPTLFGPERKGQMPVETVQPKSPGN